MRTCPKGGSTIGFDVSSHLPGLTTCTARFLVFPCDTSDVIVPSRLPGIDISRDSSQWFLHSPLINPKKYGKGDEDFAESLRPTRKFHGSFASDIMEHEEGT